MTATGTNSASPVIPLLGYCDKLSVRAGDTVGFKVSSHLTAPYSARLVRVICADPNPNGPGIIEQDIEAKFAGQYPSRVQPFYPGSYVVTDKPLQLPKDRDFSIEANIFPTLYKSSDQVIAACAGLEMGIDDHGCVYAAIGDQRATCPTPAPIRHWYQVTLRWHRDEGELNVSFHELNSAHPLSAESSIQLASHTNFNGAKTTIAAALQADGIAVKHFNGKVESPCIQQLDQNGAVSPLASWDFGKNISSLTVEDTGPQAHHGKIINLPARAMTGSNWDGSEMCWRHDTSQYGAIHFHDDDIVDFHWQDDFTFTISADLPSGIYAAKLQATADGELLEDSIPFFVCPPRGKRTADLAVLISTFTYSVYGNHARPDFKPEWKERFKAWNAYPYNPAEYPEYGLSTYNFHPDGSGICHASHRRPLLTTKPGYLTFGYGPGSGLRHLQADSHLIAWLHNKGINYDIITDDELHRSGPACLEGYRALTTGSHPEYHTPESLNTLQHYRDHGGNLLYLGGNGFYWRVALHKEQDGVIEIRRGEGGIRAWAAEPGEYYQAFDGQYGGLWRRNGRPPQALAGIGFSAQGQFEGTYYRRSKLSYDDQYQWIFRGVDEETIGDFGLSGGGAAGFELDRADTRLGSPESIAILASSETACDSFVLVPEEQLTHITTWPGEPINNLLRADMVYFEVPGGGRVFASGSITFCGSLPSNNFNNNISTIMENVMTGFLSLANT